jgi:hypothetical protein
VQIERYNALLVNVRRSCAELVKGIRGQVVMSAELDQVGVTSVRRALKRGGRQLQGAVLLARRH